MSLFNTIADACRPKVKASRMYYITLPGTGRSWQTSNSIAAMTFVHCFGLAGFGLYSEKYNGPEINYVQPTY